MERPYRLSTTSTPVSTWVFPIKYFFQPVVSSAHTYQVETNLLFTNFFNFLMARPSSDGLPLACAGDGMTFCAGVGAGTDTGGAGSLAGIEGLGLSGRDSSRGLFLPYCETTGDGSCGSSPSHVSRLSGSKSIGVFAPAWPSAPVKVHVDGVFDSGCCVVGATRLLGNLEGAG